MATATPDYRDPKIEATIDGILGTRNGKARWTYAAGIPLDAIDRTDRFQSRLGTTDGPTVRKYATIMKQGVKFPPIIVVAEGDHYLVLEGNHRYLGAKATKKVLDLPAYIVSIDDDTAEGMILSAAFNAQGTRPLTPEDTRHAVLEAKRSGYDDKKIVALFGFTAERVRAIFREAEATDRAQRLGLPIEGLTRTHLVKLADVPLDATFIEGGRLAAQSGMSAADLGSLLSEVKGIPSEADQIARIEEERTKRADDIHARQVGRRLAGAPLSDLRKVIDIVASVRNGSGTYREPGTWVPRDKDSIALWLPQVSEVATFLSAVASEMKSALHAADSE